MISTAEITMRQGRKIVGETTIHLPASVFTRDVASSVVFVAGTTTARGGKDEKEADEYHGIFPLFPCRAEIGETRITLRE